MSDNVFTVDTIAALKAFNTTTGQRAQVLGYYAKGDGGGGLFQLEAADTSSADNGGTIITPTISSAGRWKAVDKANNVKRWGAKGDGSTDDTAAIQRCINFVGTAANGSQVLLPAGTYRTSSTLSLSTTGLQLVGEGWKASRIESNATTQWLLNITGNSCGIDNLNVGFSSVPTTAAGIAIRVAGNDVKLTNFKIENSGIGVYFSNGYVAIVNNFEMYTFSQAGMYFDHWIDAYVDNFALQASVGPNMGQLGCVYITAGSEAIMLANADILSGRHALRFAGTALGNSGNYNFFENLYFDSSFDSPIKISYGKMNKFTNVWCSGGRTAGASAPGALVENSESTQFVNSTFANNGGHGAFIQSGSTNTSFTECLFESNGYGNPAGTAHGIAVDGGTKKFKIIGCISKNGLFSGQQGWGILVNAGASDNYIIQQNFVSSQGNVTGAISDSGSGGFKIVNNNL